MLGAAGHEHRATLAMSSSCQRASALRHGAVFTLVPGCSLWRFDLEHTCPSRPHGGYLVTHVSRPISAARCIIGGHLDCGFCIAYWMFRAAELRDLTVSRHTKAAGPAGLVRVARLLSGDEVHFPVSPSLQ
jgi:hypothetical protein